MSQNVRFVYFDLDDTLVDHQQAERNALADLSKRIWGDNSHGHVSALQSSYRDRNRELWHSYAEGEIGRDMLRELRFRHVVESFGLEGTSWQELDRFYMERYSTYWQMVSGARRAFELVASRLGVGVITNGFADVQHSKLERFPFIGRRSKAIVISEEVGYLKPDSRLFEKAESLAGASGSAILYVGDSYRSDVLGAVAAGWAAAWFTASPTEPLPERAFAFSDWRDFVGRLGGSIGVQEPLASQVRRP